jgi:hypothetical protein
MFILLSFAVAPELYIAAGNFSRQKILRRPLAGAVQKLFFEIHPQMCDNTL